MRTRQMLYKGAEISVSWELSINANPWKVLEEPKDQELHISGEDLWYDYNINSYEFESSVFCLC